MDALTSAELVVLFGCFTHITVADDWKDHAPNAESDAVNAVVRDIAQLYDHYRTEESVCNIHTGFDYTVHYDLMRGLDQWCGCEDVDACKRVLQELETTKGVFLGEFVKALLKINNIACEFEKIAEMTGNVAFLNKLRDIPRLTLKYVATNQSLYV